MRENIIQTICRAATAIVLLMLTMVTAWAEDVSYRDASDAKKTATGVNMLDANSLTISNGWYMADDNLTIDSRVTVSGDVKLILKDGVTLHIPKGITVEGDNSLTIYGQDGGTGVLTIDGVDNYCAGIGVVTGSGNSGGTVAICGGVVNVKGGHSCVRHRRSVHFCNGECAWRHHQHQRRTGDGRWSLWHRRNKRHNAQW